MILILATIYLIEILIRVKSGATGINEFSAVPATYFLKKDMYNLSYIIEEAGLRAES